MANYQEEDVQAFKEADINLCGGVLSGYGDDGSFRGKVYNEIVRRITGQSLYQSWIPVEAVADMYQKLMSCRLKNYPDREGDIENLRKFFRVSCSQKTDGT